MITREEMEVAKARLQCCANPVIGSDWAYGVSGPCGPYDEAPDHLILRVSNIRCLTCGTDYEIDPDCAIEQVQRDALALRIRSDPTSPIVRR